MRFPATPGWGPLVLVVGAAWVCVPYAHAGVFVCVCAGGVLVVFWVTRPPPLSSRAFWWVRRVVCVWRLCVLGGPSPVLAEGPRCGSPPLLADVLWFWWWVVPRKSLLRVLVAIPRHPWLGSPAVGGAWSLANPG